MKSWKGACLLIRLEIASSLQLSMKDAPATFPFVSDPWFPHHDKLSAKFGSRVAQQPLAWPWIVMHTVVWGSSPDTFQKTMPPFFKYLRTTLTQNFIQEEIKSRLKPGNACYQSVQNLLSSSLLSKNLKIEIYRTIILPVVLYGYETWSLTLREERRLRLFENRVLKRIFGPKRGR